MEIENVKTVDDALALVRRDPLGFMFAVWDAENAATESAAFAKRIKRLPYLRQPRYLAPLANGRWLPLNYDCCPLGVPDIRPYVPAQFPHHSWEFPPGFDPRALKGALSPAGCGCGRSDGWGGMWLQFRKRNYGLCVATVIAATKDPLGSAALLFDDPPLPPDASARR